MPSEISSKVLLQVRDLKTWFPIKRGVLARTRGHVRAVDGVSMDLRAGETVGLVGESGCGKTTLGRTVMGLEKSLSGEILMDGTRLWPASHDESLPWRRRIQMVFQDPYSSLNPRLTVLDTLTEGLIEHRMVRARERHAAAVRLLREVGMDEDALHRYPHEFSGGQRQRISIARAIALRPDIVVCDEAVSALDVSVRAQVLNLLHDLRREHALSYIFISHDLGVVRHIAHRVFVMYLGVIVEEGGVEAVLDHPVHPYSRALLSAVPAPFGERKGRLVLQGEVPSPANPPAGCRFHTRCPWAQEECARSVPPLESFAAGVPSRRVACLRKADIPLPGP